MFIPLGDAPNDPSKKPWVNYALIAINAAVYLWAITTHRGEVAYNAWVLEWGFVPVAPRLETYFTHMFMHGGFLHIAGNMLFLWVFGDNVERRLGHVGYLVFYLGCGLAAVHLFSFLAPGSTIPMVGASGAIFGVEGFYFLAFPRNRVRVLVWVLLVFTFWVPARAMLGISFVYNLIYMLTPQGVAEGGGVAYAAHVGGFVAGLLLAATFRWTTPKPRAPGPFAAGDQLERARRLISGERYAEAERLLQGILDRRVHGREAPEAALLLGLLYSRVGQRPEAARQALQFAARLHPDPAARLTATQELQRLT